MGRCLSLGLLVCSGNFHSGALVWDYAREQAVYVFCPRVRCELADIRVNRAKLLILKGECIDEALL